MDSDDEFGDLYADIGQEELKTSTSDHFGVEKDGDRNNENDENLLYGASIITSSLATSSRTLPLPPSSTPISGLKSGLADREVDNDERFLYGQLYGVKMETMDEAASPVRRVESKLISGFRAERGKETNSRVLDPGTGGSISLTDEERVDCDAGLMGRNLEEGLRGVSSSVVCGVKGPARDSVPYQNCIFDGFSNRILASERENTASRRLTHPKKTPESSSPGLSGRGHMSVAYSGEEDAEGLDMRGEWVEENEAGGERGEADNEAWEDSDSEDDLQIVLNDETRMDEGSERPADGGPVEGSEDEDEVDLVIVAGDDYAVDAEEQEWEADPAPTDLMPGLAGAPVPVCPDRPPGAEERGLAGKGSGNGAVSPGVLRMGYSGQGYHNHYMQYKYVRPGAAVSSAMTLQSQTSPLPTDPGGRGAPSDPTGGVGGGDWLRAGGRRSSGPRSQGVGSSGTSWGGARGFPNGMEFNLPPTKTVFDVDLSSLEEKPWRRPGVEMTDYFNFGFNENTWKQYCRQLAQLRLEATMQSKIRVYESGRSEQEYDPDLPPELAAAAGMQEAGDPNVQQQRSQDGGPGGGGCRSRGAGRGRVLPPTGRAIQVEGGGGERRPSADVRRQRTRDSDAVIQIVLQDASEKEPASSVPPAETLSEDFGEEDGGRHGGGASEQVRRFERGGFPRWGTEGPPNTWECEDMPMGPGGIPIGPHGGTMLPSRRRGVDGPGPFSVGPGMPMHQSGTGPNFGMFAEASFCPPPVGREGMVRPPMYSGPRAALPLPAPRPPSEVFPPMMVPPVDYHEPPRRTQEGLPVDWGEEPSNGSEPNWNLRASRSLRECKGDGNGDWPLDSGERCGGSLYVRRGRDFDQASHGERSVEEPSVDLRSGEHKRSISRDRLIGESDWDGGYSSHSSKKQKVQVLVETSTADTVNAKSRKSTAKEEPAHSREYLKDCLVEEEISQPRRGDAGHSKSGAGKTSVAVDGSFVTQRKEVTWSRRKEQESKNRRQHREREEAQRKKIKDEEPRQHCSREDQEREGRSKEDFDRDWRRARKEKEDEKVSKSDRSKRYGEDHSWTSREPEESRARETTKRVSVEREAERMKGKRRRDEDRGKMKGRLDDRGEGRARRYEKADDIRSWEDSRKYEEKNIRFDSGHASRDHFIESRRTADEQRSHKDKRAWEGSSAKEMATDINGSVSNVGDEKSYRPHTDGSKKRKVEEYRTGGQFDKAMKDSDKLAASSARYKEKKFGPTKRGHDEYFHRRVHEKDTGSRASRVSKDGKSQLDTVSLEEEEEERRERSKLERWTSSKKEREAVIDQCPVSRKKYHASDAVHKVAPSISQLAGSDRQQHTRADQEWKENQKEKQQSLLHSSEKRQSDVDVKESALFLAVGGACNDTAPDPQPSPAKDITENRKERIERLRLQAAERHKKGEDAVHQPGSVEEVKPERPARKRRWGNG